MSLADLIGHQQSEKVIRELGELIETFKILGWKELRPWPEAFQGLKPPQWDYKSIEQRILTNFMYYRTNYLLVVCVIFLLRLLLSPVLLLCIILCALVTVYVGFVYKGPIIIGEIHIDRNGKLIGCGIFSFIVLGLCGALENILWSILISFVICLIHMLLRPRSITSKSSLAYEEVKVSAYNMFSSDKGGFENDMTASDIEDPAAAINDDFGLGGNMRKRSHVKKF